MTVDELKTRWSRRGISDCLPEMTIERVRPGRVVVMLADGRTTMPESVPVRRAGAFDSTRDLLAALRYFELPRALDRGAGGRREMVGDAEDYLAHYEGDLQNAIKEVIDLLDSALACEEPSADSVLRAIFEFNLFVRFLDLEVAWPYELHNEEGLSIEAYGTLREVLSSRRHMAALEDITEDDERMRRLVSGLRDGTFDEQDPEQFALGVEGLRALEHYTTERHPAIEPSCSVEAAKQAYAAETRRCQGCGASGDNLDWSWWCSSKMSWECLAGRAGWMVVCPSCDRVVGFFLEVLS